MNILMPYKLRQQPLLSLREIFSSCGHTCRLFYADHAEKVHRHLSADPADLLLTAESALFPRVHSLSVPSVYYGASYACADRRLPPDCASYWIAHEDLSFEYMLHGAQEKRVRVCGIPLHKAMTAQWSREVVLRSLGVDDTLRAFSVITDGVSPNEIKATVRACGTLCPDTVLLLWCGDQERRLFYRTAFASLPNVYVPDLPDAYALSFSADAVFMPANASLVSAAARQRKIILLLHSASPHCRRNAAFLDARGVAFCGKTAADNVSYACRLLSGARLQQNMLHAQEKNVIGDAEQRAEKFLEEIPQN